jgi:hypothetical protein
MKIWIGGLLVASAALAGCSSDDPDATVAYCVGFGAGATVQWNTCTNCTVNNTGNVSDGNLDTAASVVPNALSTTDTFRLTATSVNDIAGGGAVGLWITQPAGLTDFDTEISTYLDGDPTPVEVLDVATNGVTLGADEGTAAQGFIGMQTTQAFDQVVIERTSTYASGQTPVYFVYEACSDGGAE